MTTEKKAPFLSVLIVYQTQLHPLHLHFLIDALNQQSSPNFNTFWVDQSSGSDALEQLLAQKARFSYVIQKTDDIEIGGVRCWELHSPFQQIMQHSSMAPYWTYLHLECLPQRNWVKVLEQTLPEMTRFYGARFIAGLYQLWCPLFVQQLHVDRYFEQLQHSRPLTWHERLDYYATRPYAPVSYWECPWQEDAFVMPTQLTHDLALFSAVKKPMYFQDVFDLFKPLAQRPYTQDIHWLKILDAVIYHVQHPRQFLEYRREFLDAARQAPEHFAHLALYDLAHSNLHYEESIQQRLAHTTSETLWAFYTGMRFGPRGTTTEWIRAIDRYHLAKQD